MENPYERYIVLLRIVPISIANITKKCTILVIANMALQYWAKGNANIAPMKNAARAVEVRRTLTDELEARDLGNKGVNSGNPRVVVLCTTMQVWPSIMLHSQVAYLQNFWL